MHILDVSGSTNEKGEATVGYDPINDAEWLHGEIHAWVFNNLWKKWSSVTRRHAATKASVGPTLLGQLSGYGKSKYWEGGREGGSGFRAKGTHVGTGSRGLRVN